MHVCLAFLVLLLMPTALARSSSSYRISDHVFNQGHDYTVWKGAKTMQRNRLVSPLSVLLSVLAIGILGGTSNMTLAQTSTFVDDFDDGDAAGWSPVTGTWQVLNYVYAQTDDPGGANNDFVTFFTDRQFTDFEMQVEITSTSALQPGYRNVGVVFRGDGFNNFYRVLYHSNFPTGALRVEKWVDGIGTVVVENTDTGFTPGTTNTLTVTAEGDMFSAFLNGTPITSWVDNTFAVGFIGLATENGSADFDDVQVSYASEVAIDIKPGSDPNCFSINGHGVIPVAILGSADFDVSEIDTLSLAFDGLMVRVRGNRGPLCSSEDSNGDGFTDLVCHFEDNPDYWLGGDDTGTITGVLFDGSEFEGSDAICVVP